MTSPPVRLSLVAHTNVGKTTLARTLLGRDVGEVRDAPHVTEFAEMNVLVETPAGDQLQLWDTPGFGDSVRLLRRLRGRATPLGWFLAEVWDRWRDRAFWASQQALRHVRDDSDVMLYLVNATEPPEAAAYVAPEMELLSWVGKPVIVLLNQMGAPRAAAEEAADIDRWRRHVGSFERVCGVLPLDAFARCWVQEGVLLGAIERALDGDERMRRLNAEWTRQQLARFDAASAEVAASLGRIAAARVPLEAAGAGWTLERLLPGRRPSAESAGRALAEALDAEVRASTGRLLALHGIEGRAAGAILERVASQVKLRESIGERTAAVIGGAVSGALGGLAADVMAGGLTLGGGMLAGGLLGAFGAAGAAHAINVVRGTGGGFAVWDAPALAPIAEAALLRYLAIAHFGRGRGQWAEGEAPAHWRAVVAEALVAEQAALQALWDARETTLANAGEAEQLGAALQPLAARLMRGVLERLYPGTWPG
jgi:hypothetical protein